MSTDLHIPIIANIGLLAILAWIVSFFSASLFRDFRTRGYQTPLIVGLTFGAGAALLMNIPVELQQGIIGDGRGAPVLLSGIIGGPVAALVAGTIAAAMRYYIGGAGAPGGVIYIILFAVIGCLWRFIAEKKNLRAMHWSRLIAVATLATIVTIPVVFLLPEAARMNVIVIIWPQLLVANILGSLILGSLVERERQREKISAELIEKEKLATLGADSKSRFLAAMSHEIRTPINTIMGALQLLQQKVTSDEDKKDIKTALNAGDVLLSLIGQVLDFAKIEAGVVSINKEAVSINAIIHDLSSMFGNLANDRGITINFHDDLPDDTVVSADQAKIRQILINLIGNALKFTAQGQVDVYARSSTQGGDDIELEFEVKDTGSGIAPDDHDLIFDEFGQSESGKNFTGGTGLGLSISRQLAHAMNGEISVQSDLGKGASFFLRLNVSRAAVTDIVHAEEEVETPAGGLWILLAEDNDINRVLATRMLEAEGHEVVGVEDGQMAVDLIVKERQKFDLVFMDIQMPRLCGDEATQIIIREVDAADRPPIIALTANALTEQMESYRKIGMTDVLTKPVQITEMRRMIARYAVHNQR